MFDAWLTRLTLTDDINKPIYEREVNTAKDIKYIHLQCNADRDFHTDKSKDKEITKSCNEGSLKSLMLLLGN